MKPNQPWSRRTFLQGIGCASVSGALNLLLPRKASSFAEITRPSFAADSTAGFAYVGSSGMDRRSASPEFVEDGIHVFEVRGKNWTRKQLVSSRSPVFLTLHPNQQFLYAVNEVAEHHGLPCGTVEAYRVDAQSGQLTLINRQGLSLSGIRPRHIVISPDGRYLVLAVHGGGAYNVLPIGSNGELGHVTGILKEVGSSQHPHHQTSAHPHSMVIDASGRYLLATDQGCDRLSVFTLEDGRIMRRHQTLLKQGDGPGHLVSHPSGQFFYVSNASNGSVAGYRFIEATGEISTEICRSRTSTSTDKMWNQNVLTIPASGKFLYSSVNAGQSGNSGGIAVWRINPVTGELSHIQMWGEKKFSSQVLVSTRDGRGLLVVDSGQHRVVHIRIDSDNGQIRNISTLAEIVNPSALVMKYL